MALKTQHIAAAITGRSMDREYLRVAAAKGGICAVLRPRTEHSPLAAMRLTKALYFAVETAMELLR